MISFIIKNHTQLRHGQLLNINYYEETISSHPYRTDADVMYVIRFFQAVQLNELIIFKVEELIFFGIVLRIYKHDGISLANVLFFDTENRDLKLFYFQKPHYCYSTGRTLYFNSINFLNFINKLTLFVREPEIEEERNFQLNFHILTYLFQKEYDADNSASRVLRPCLWTIDKVKDTEYQNLFWYTVFPIDYTGKTIYPADFPKKKRTVFAGYLRQNIPIYLIIFENNYGLLTDNKYFEIKK